MEVNITLDQLFHMVLFLSAYPESILTIYGIYISMEFT